MRGDKTRSFKWDDKPSEPMNPYAERDFAHAVREATNNFSEELKRIGEQMKANVADAKISFIDFDDMPTKYSGIMRLPYSPIGAWNDMVNILATSGYAVSAEVETEDGEQYVIIAFERVE